MTRTDSAKHRPNGISIILPAYNEEKYIGRVLEAIHREISQLKIPTEIILVDNNSNDRTVQIAQSFGIKVLSCDIKRPSVVRNTGALESNYSILAFIDADCLVPTGWASRIIEAFQSIEIKAYGGSVIAPSDGNWVETGWSCTNMKPFRKDQAILPGASFSVRASSFVNLGGFDKNLVSAEDDDLSRRINQLEGTVVIDSQQTVIHLGYPKSLSDLFKKQIWQGSTQFKAHGLLKDKALVVTILWFVAIALIPFAIVFSTAFILIFLVLIIFCVPISVAASRHKASQTVSFSQRVASYIISFVFLAGRSIGALKELTNIIFPKRS